MKAELAIKVDMDAISKAATKAIIERFEGDWFIDEIGDSIAELINQICNQQEVKNAAKEMLLKKIRGEK